jgi:hypothetical protein
MVRACLRFGIVLFLMPFFGLLIKVKGGRGVAALNQVTN